MSDQRISPNRSRAPRYSVLLPTRNGGPLLETVIQSVLDQAYEDFELVVSDNANEDATPEILARYADHPRMRVVRQPELLDVTANWNAALAASTGERVMLLGDDDLLLPGYFTRADALLERHGNPEVLLYNAYCFFSAGYFGTTVTHYQETLLNPSMPLAMDAELPLDERRSLVADLFRFDFRIPFNAQAVLVSRELVDRMPARLFEPPFPDVYEVAAVLLAASRLVVCSDRLVVLGCSPGSMAHVVLSNEFERRARDYLGFTGDFPGALPGALMSGNYATMLSLKRDFGADLAGIEIDRGRYALQQVYSWYMQRRTGELDTRALVQRVGRLGAGDWLSLLRTAAAQLRPGKVSRHLKTSGDGQITTFNPASQPLPEISSIADFAKWIEAGKPRPLVPT